MCREIPEVERRRRLLLDGFKLGNLDNRSLRVELSLQMAVRRVGS
jgi:hypothetical protein